MGEKTNISWCDHTRNIAIGCTKATYKNEGGKTVIHPACEHCYAEELAKRYGWAKWGAKQVRKVLAMSSWRKVLAWAKKAATTGERRTVFLESLGDILDEEMDSQEDMRSAFWREMQYVRATHRVCGACGGYLGTPFRALSAASPAKQEELGIRPCVRRKTIHRDCATAKTGGLTYLVLTKRPERWTLIPEDVRPLVWFGTSAADQPTWDIWTSRLIQARGFGGLFVSLEPQVAPVRCGFDRLHLGPERIRKVIQGGESGSRARIFDIEWARSVRDQCEAAGVPYFLKQLGANTIDSTSVFGDPGGDHLLLDDSKGSDPSEWPDDLRHTRTPWPPLRQESSA